MSLSSRVKNKIVDTINTTFASLGHANGMRMPKSSDNREAAVWELAVAQHVARLAEKRKAAAEHQLVAAGVIPDKEKNPQPPGRYGIIYTGNSTHVTMEVRSGGKRVNIDAVVEFLSAAGVAAKLLDEAVSKATTFSKPAHVITANFTGEVDFGK